jgi:hypothetical protein
MYCESRVPVLPVQPVAPQALPVLSGDNGRGCGWVGTVKEDEGTAYSC